MLSKSRCPHTGVINFYTDGDPFLSVGSVAETGVPARYVWRCHVADGASGSASDMALAEAYLRTAIAGSERQRVNTGHRRIERALVSHAAIYWQKLNDLSYQRP